MRAKSARLEKRLQDIREQILERLKKHKDLMHRRQLAVNENHQEVHTMSFKDLRTAYGVHLHEGLDGGGGGLVFTIH